MSLCNLSLTSSYRKCRLSRLLKARLPLHQKSHQMCLATVEAPRARERGEMEALSERNRGLERANQKLLNDQHRMREELSGLRGMQQLLREVRDTVASWQQRLEGTVDPPNHVDGASMSAALPAATSVPGMWDTKGKERECSTTAISYQRRITSHTFLSSNAGTKDMCICSRRVFDII